MSKKTDNLGLELTTSGTVYFENWRKSINGDNDGITTELSNMQIIDDEVGSLKEIVDGVRVDIKDAIEAQGVEVGNIPFNEYYLKIAEIEGSGGTIDGNLTSNMLIGWTMPITWKNAPAKEREFYLKSDYGPITITGLDTIGTVVNNNTKNVQFTIIENGDTSLVIPFTIQIMGPSQTYNYIGRVFYYGTEPSTGQCLGVMSLIMPDDFGAGELGINWDIIESTSLPSFSNESTTWNSYYPHQLASFKRLGNIAFINISFMAYCYSFNQPLDLGSVTSIDRRFMWYCHSFNQPLNLGEIITIPGEFMYFCYSFNQPLDLSKVTSISYQFMLNCYNFNQSLDLSNVTGTVGSSFMNTCTNFNQSLNLSNVTKLDSYFMNSCVSFNQSLDLSNVTTINESFMLNCYNFNQSLDLSNVTTISQSFMYRCYGFNQPLDLSGVMTVPNMFMADCCSFNQPLDLSNVTSITTLFMQNCYSFNQPLYLSKVTSIGNTFMRSCYRFNQLLDLSSITSIASEFMLNCYSLTLLRWEVNVYPTDNNSLSQVVNSKTSSSGTGIKIIGTYASNLKAALPDRTTTPYRKLVL